MYVPRASKELIFQEPIQNVIANNISNSVCSFSAAAKFSKELYIDEPVVYIIRNMGADKKRLPLL